MLPKDQDRPEPRLYRVLAVKRDNFSSCVVWWSVHHVAFATKRSKGSEM